MSGGFGGAIVRRGLVEPAAPELRPAGTGGLPSHAAELRVLYFEDLEVGLSETLSKTIASSDVVGFAEITGDRNPIHLSEHFAARTPFGTRIATACTRPG